MKQSLIYVLTFIVFISSCSKETETKMQLNPPVIYSISPQEARPGSIITIEGENFSRLRVDNKVLFNGVEAEIIHFNETTIHARAPQGSNDGPVTVTIAGKSVEGPLFSFIQPPAPTGETVIVKVLSVGIQPFSAASAHRTQAIMEYCADIAKTRDVDFMVAREVDSATNRSVKVDRPKVLSELSGLPYYQFSRGIIADYQTGGFGISVYSKHPITQQWELNLGNNRILSVLQVQVTPQSQIAFAGVQLEDVIASQTLRNSQATLVNGALNDVMVPLVLAGGLFMLAQEPLEDPMFKIFNQEGFVPGCTSCEWTFPASTTVNAIADFISYRWAREARVIQYETLDAAPAPGSGNRKPVYVEIEFKL